MWQKVAYLQPYFKDRQAFSQLHCQGFEHLILANFSSSRWLNKQTHTPQTNKQKNSREGESNLNESDTVNISLNT